ncbi:MAG: aromatic ring-hydroxylating dioxygenase subunit alpha [Candidatus Obscuribacter phosphatis]|uniref:Aromatic ring-hydroxylating dioxygenase subunit alpha n=1 Tax=Candidatus Obscuribacter phosphatis TaxID=1906157 RepID=A0A8J7PGK1_9BACT|nr:aromatic ring-hydroxylating dioxygenase subunit alpha [Candidatus Obscuribacter phosphatis]
MSMQTTLPKTDSGKADENRNTKSPEWTPSETGLDNGLAGSIETEASESGQQPYGKTYTRNMWYYALPSEKLKKGEIESKVMLGEPLVIGRDNEGKLFALRDICPHQAIPLSAGPFDGKELMCPFHGWKFDTSGVCTDIPSLCSDQKMNLCKIKTANYPVTEVLGSIWVYFGDNPQDLPEVPHAPGLDGLKFAKNTVTLQLPTHIDYAVAALIDTAHVPYVHKSWWWRSAKALKEKNKKYIPSGTGWTMVKHQPSKHSIAFKLIGQFIETEISFRLPGCRREYLTFNNRTFLSGITTLTPIDETHTELNHTTYWTLPIPKFIADPVLNYFVTTFLKQDQSLALMQEKIINKYKPRLIMTIKDAGTPGHWYFLLKKEWNSSQAEKRPFKNPIKESILRWRT